MKYLSPVIQNELIEVLANQLEHNIVSDITSAPLFTIITDTTQDVSKIDHLNQVYRYVKIVAQTMKALQLWRYVRVSWTSTLTRTKLQPSLQSDYRNH